MLEIKGVLNDKSQSDTENILNNIKWMVSKPRKCVVKSILISILVYTARALLEVLEKIQNWVIFVLVMVWYILILETSKFYLIILLHI